MIGSQSLSIAFVALGFPPDVGGTELYNVEYARRLYARGHDLKVLTWESESEGQQEADAALPFEVARLPYRRRRKQLEAGGVDEALAGATSAIAIREERRRRRNETFRVPKPVGRHFRDVQPRVIRAGTLASLTSNADTSPRSSNPRSRGVCFGDG